MTWENGNRYAILGPSGCGKTTMLNIVSGLVRPSAGRILFDDKDVTPVGYAQLLRSNPQLKSLGKCDCFGQVLFMLYDN